MPMTAATASGVRVGDVRVVAAEQHLVGQALQIRERFGWERVQLFGEVGEHHGGIEIDATELLCESKEFAVLRQSHVRDDEFEVCRATP
jgi:hypothetical protein